MALPPVIPDLPPAPSRSDGPAGFTPKADAMVAALQPMVTAQNQQASWMNDTAQQVHADAIYAATSATNAADSASAANAAKLAAQQAVTAAEQAGAEQVALAVAARDEAEAFAEAAGAGVPAERTPFTVLQVNAAGQVAWGYGLPDRANAKVGQSLMLGANKVPGFGWAGDQVGDILSTARIPGADYLPAAGGIYLKSAYPALAAALGNIGEPAGLVWSNTGQAITSSSNDGIATDGNGMWLKGNKRSTDNGVTWSATNLPFSLTKAATDGNGVWIATVAGGSTWRSLDNGATWSIVGGTTAQIGRQIGGVATNKSGVWIVTGYSGKTIRSTDNGLTWTQLSPPWSNSTPGPALWLSGQVWLTASNYRSLDNGATWAALGSTVVVSDYDSYFEKLPSGGLVKFINGAVYTSKDQGLTWVMSNSVSVNNTAQRGLACDSSGLVVVTSGTANCSVSLNEGDTWQTLTLPAVAGAIAFGAGKFLTNHATGGSLQSVEDYPYDTATQFKLPSPLPVRGLKHYIKAKEAA